VHIAKVRYVSFYLTLTLLTVAFTCTAAHGVDKESITRQNKLWQSAAKIYNAKKYKKAAELYKQFSASYPNDPRTGLAIYRQGNCRNKTGNTHRALQLWESLVHKEKFNMLEKGAGVYALAGLIKLYTSKGKDDKAEAAIVALLKMYPEEDITVDVCTEKAEQYLREGSYQKAADLYRKVELRITSESDIRHCKLAYMLSSGSSGSPAGILDMADKSLSDNELETAIFLYEKVLSGNISNDMKAQANTKLAWCIYLSGNKKEAEEIWKEVIDTTTQGEKWRGKSRWHLIRLNAGPYHNTKRAIELCDIQAEEFGRKFLSEQAMFTKAWLYLMQEDWKEAQEAFNELIEAFPEKAAQPAIQRYLTECRKGLEKGK
jgi:tetratricopeptide (TPR) repeat protein